MKEKTNQFLCSVQNSWNADRHCNNSYKSVTFYFFSVHNSRGGSGLNSIGIDQNFDLMPRIKLIMIREIQVIHVIHMCKQLSSKY